MTETKPIPAEDFPTRMAAIMGGKLPLPNPEEIAPPAALNLIAASATSTITEAIHRARLEGSKGSMWARYMLSYTQGGQLSGEGIAFLWFNSGGKAFRFAICKHQIEARPGGNPSRGWHPSHCTVCGLNTSVDSGD